MYRKRIGLFYENRGGGLWKKVMLNGERWLIQNIDKGTGWNIGREGNNNRIRSSARKGIMKLWDEFGTVGQLVLHNPFRFLVGM